MGMEVFLFIWVFYLHVWNIELMGAICTNTPSERWEREDERQQSVIFLRLDSS
jgi:hypothetical protein